VMAQGAQTDWGNDSIVLQCADKQVEKAAQYLRLDPGGGTPVALNLPSTKVRTDERIVLRDEQTDEPVREQRYLAHLHDGSTVEGTTDEQGRTSLALSDAIGSIRFDFLPDEPRR
ncbi:MAG: type VI secretion system tip protein VgrG, partial [Telluria sp.]